MKENNEFDFDVFVIGGGSGGISMSKRASQLGAKVGLADYVEPSESGTKWGLGGTCVNVGCIPKKLMHFTGLLGETKHDLHCSGWDIDPNAKHNWERMLENVNTHIKKINWGYKKQLQKENVKYFNCFATMKDKHTIVLRNKKGKENIVTSKFVVIATGGRPKYLDIPEIKEIAITSDDIFWRKESPGKTLVIGSGYTSIECAGFLRGLGYEVDLLIRNTLLRNFDRDMVKRIYEDAKEKGIGFKAGRIKKVNKKKENGEVEIEFQVKKNFDIINGRSEESNNEDYDKENEVLETSSYKTILLAIGRIPQTHKIKLEEIGVKINPITRKIPVSEYYSTNIKNIFAIGDIKDRSFELTPIAIKEGIILADYLFNKIEKPKPINYNAVVIMLK